MLLELAQKLRVGETTSRALTKEFLARIREKDGDVNAFITVCETEALRMADEADRRIQRGDAPLLCGIPMALKDNICTEGIRTTCASGMLADFVPPYSACVWERLRDAGAVLLGKTNMDEFAMGAGGETSAFGVCRNPHDPDFVAGGSSGGSAAAVAAGMACYALGSDTGGSVRVPASYCGVVGVKPTYGRISRRGLAAFASSLDQIGVMASSVEDSALVLSAIAGWDEGDPTTSRRIWDAEIRPDVRGLRIGIPREAVRQADESAVRAMRMAEECLKANGAAVVRAELPPADRAYAAYYILSACEASSNLARYDGIRYGTTAGDAERVTDTFTQARQHFGDEVKRRLTAGAAALSVEQRGEAYDRAQRSRREITVQMNGLFSVCDVILTPTVPQPAYRIGAHEGEAVAYRSCDAFTVAASLAGLPAISIPVPTAGVLPMGVQLIAPAFREDLLYRAAVSLEEALRHAQ